MRLPAVRALLRLARRDALRHRGRSVLITLTLAFPVVGLVAAATLIHALSVPLATKATWSLGHADALVGLTGDASPMTESAAAAAVAGKVPHGSRVLAFRSTASRVRTAQGLVQATVLDLPYDQPLVRGMVHPLHGRAPRSAGEVAVSQPVASAHHLTLGSTLSLVDVSASPLRVVGIAVAPDNVSVDVAWVAAGTLATGSYDTPQVLVSLPASAAGLDLATVFGSSASVETRADLLRRSTGNPLANNSEVSLTVLVAGLGLLEAVLMAGAAFAVGARRSQRDLALLGATGGDAGHIRGVVLAGGLVLGLIGGLVGTGLGTGLAQLLLPYAPRFSGHVYAGTHPRLVELAGAVLLGLVTGLVSAWLPARGAARASVVASLAGRRGVVRSSARLTGLALATAAAGTLIAAAAGRTTRLGGEQINVILLGAAVAELGFAACAPALVGLSGRFAGRLPLTARLSLRDIARHRSRTGPAVAAIMATLSGVVAMSVYVASSDARSKASYQPLLPRTMIALASSTSTPLSPSLVAAVADGLPVKRQLSFGQATGDRDAFVGEPGGPQSQVTIATPALLVALGDPKAARALADGSLVLLRGSGQPVGRTTIRVQDNGTTATAATLQAVASTAGPYNAFGSALVSPATAQRLALDPTLNATLLVLSRNSTAKDRQQVTSALLARQSPAATSQVYSQVETGLDDGKSLLVPLALLAISTVVTFGVTTISTALSSAESRPDLATLGAVGAGPAVRRRLAMTQAAVLALLGGLLGIAAGLVPMAAVIALRSGVLIFTVPWQVIVLALVGVPAIAGAGAGLFTRSRLPLVRRLT